MTAFEKVLAKEQTKRKERINDLHSFLKNPGYFSILLLGKRGSGKSFWLESIIKSQYPDKVFKTVRASDSIATTDFWEGVFKEINHGFLIINEVEKLDKQSQELLVSALSTVNGMFGFKKKKYQFHIIFTSCFDISALRDTENALNHHFFDRIAQLVTKLPSFKDSDINIWNDFKATWEKMKFGDKYPMPTEVLQVWLEKYSSNLHGNFRDLDKIAINWQQQQLNGLTDERVILENVKSGFVDFYHYSEQKTEMHNTFEFKKGKTKDEMEHEWRAQFKTWAKQEYGTLEKAATALQISKRTFEKW